LWTLQVIVTTALSNENDEGHHSNWREVVDISVRLAVEAGWPRLVIIMPAVRSVVRRDVQSDGPRIGRRASAQIRVRRGFFTASEYSERLPTTIVDAEPRRIDIHDHLTVEGG
jgi:hypothetical protein